MEKIVTHEAVRDFGKSIVIGIAENEELTGRQIEIRYADENYAVSAFSMPTEGTLPVNENEIALDTITLDKLSLPHELGQEITLKWRKDLNSGEYTISGTVGKWAGFWYGNASPEPLQRQKSGTGSGADFNGYWPIPCISFPQHSL